MIYTNEEDLNTILDSNPFVFIEVITHYLENIYIILIWIT